MRRSVRYNNIMLRFIHAITHKIIIAHVVFSLFPHYFMEIINHIHIIYRSIHNNYAVLAADIFRKIDTHRRARACLIRGIYQPKVGQFNIHKMMMMMTENRK